MRRHRLRAVAAAALAVALSGCWYQAGGGPANTRHNTTERALTIDNVAGVAEQWRTPVDGFVTEPLLSGDRAYVATRDQQDDDDSLLDTLAVQAYDAETGELAWERSLLPVDGAPVGGGIGIPALVDDVLWVPYWHDGLGPCAGALARLDPATGAVLGTDPTGTGIDAVVASGSTIAYTESDCSGVRLVVRDTTTRAVVGSYRFPAGAGRATPTISQGRLFLLSGGNLYAFPAGGCDPVDCAPLWTRPEADSFFDFLRLAAGPSGTLITYGPSSDPEGGATIVVRDAATGDVRWEAEPRYTGQLPGAITGVAVADGTLFVAGSQADPDGFDSTAVLDAYPVAGCGQDVCPPAWSADLGRTRPSHEPTVAGGVVYVPLVATGSVAPAVAAIDAAGCGSPTCAEVVRVPLTQSPVNLAGTQSYATSIGGGRLVVAWLPGLYGSADTEIMAFGPATD
ncbi:MAG: PQQ-binding-like beta-propeller repeat protein [Acidimicrobiales bacterium]|nr:PQQ-binding-like beta-propeller repeat protein [Acidimicrobiales bacterium]